MKHAAKVAAFLAIFVFLNLILCCFMPPDNGSSLAMWRAYHEKEQVDIAVIGSSLASCSLPEDELSAATGKTVSLMATNAQSWDMSKIALETLLREHTPERVILVMDLANMTGDPFPKAQKGFFLRRAANSLAQGCTRRISSPYNKPGQFYNRRFAECIFSVAERRMAD